MYNLVQVYFLQSPTGAPYLLAYSKGDTGAVRPQMAEMLVNDGIAEYVDTPTPASAVAPPASSVFESVKADNDPDFSTEEAVAAVFGDDVDRMKAYCDKLGIKYGYRASTPDYFHRKIAKHHA